MKPRLDRPGKAVCRSGRGRPNATAGAGSLSKRFKPHLLHNCLVSHHCLAAIQCILTVVSLCVRSTLASQAHRNTECERHERLLQTYLPTNIKLELL